MTRIKKGVGVTLFPGATKDQVQIPDVNVGVVSQENATFGKDNKVDNIIASQYLNTKDKLNETYVDKVGMETGLYADIQNIDTKILDTYRIIGMPNNDIFSRRDLSPQEKIALSRERRDTAVQRNTHLRTLQQAKQKEISDLATFEANKAKAQESAYKEALIYQKQQLDERKFGLEEKKFGLTLGKAEADLELKQRQFGLDVEKFELAKEEKYFVGITNKVLLDTPDGTILKTRLPSVTNPNGGKECGEYVNDVMGGSIGRFGDTYKDKLDVATEQYGGIGAAAVWNPGNTQYGHVGIIVGEQGNDWVIKSSNLNFDGAISTDLVPKNHISGYKNVAKTSADKNYTNYETVEDYFKDTRTKKFAKVSTEQMQKVLFDDIHNKKFKFSYKDKDGRTQISEELTGFLKSGVLDQNDIIEYRQLANANKYSIIDIEIIIPKLKKVQGRESMVSVLTSLAVNGQLDGKLFEGAEEFYIGDGDGYNAIQKYFPDDVDDLIKEAQDNANRLKEKYKVGVYNTD